MASPNTNAIYTQAGAITGGPLLSTTTRNDGVGTIGTDMLLVASGGVNGTLIEKVRCFPVASAPNVLTTSDCVTFYKSSIVSGSTTTANTISLGNVNLPVVTANPSTAKVYPLEETLNIFLNSGESLLASHPNAPTTNSSWVIFVPDARNY